MAAARVATLQKGQRADLVEGLPIGRASELLNVGECSAYRARVVQDAGVPELGRAVDQDRCPVSAAARIAKLEPEIETTGNTRWSKPGRKSLKKS